MTSGFKNRFLKFDYVAIHVITANSKSVGGSMRQSIGKVFKMVLATVIATQGAWMMPAFAASGSKRLAVKEVSAQELKLEFGAGGGGGGEEPTPPPSDGGGSCSGNLYASRMTTQCNGVPANCTIYNCDLKMVSETYTPIQFTKGSDEYVTRFTNSFGTTNTFSYSYNDGCYKYVTGFGIQGGAGSAGGNVSWEENCAQNRTLNVGLEPNKNANIWKRREESSYTVNRKYQWSYKGNYAGEAGTGGQTYKTTQYLYWAGAPY
jgi:hypothetical protein